MPVDAAHSATAAKRTATLGLTLPLFVAAAALLVLAKVLGGPLALPVLGVLLLSAGFIVAVALYLAGSRIGQGSGGAWALAGALVFLGFAAALLSDGNETLAQLERMQAPGLVGN